MYFFTNKFFLCINIYSTTDYANATATDNYNYYDNSSYWNNYSAWQQGYYETDPSDGYGNYIADEHESKPEEDELELIGKLDSRKLSKL